MHSVEPKHVARHDSVLLSVYWVYSLSFYVRPSKESVVDDFLQRRSVFSPNERGIVPAELSCVQDNERISVLRLICLLTQDAAGKEFRVSLHPRGSGYQFSTIPYLAHCHTAMHKK